MGKTGWLVSLSALVALLFLVTNSEVSAQQVLDSFDSVTQWSTNPAKGVEIAIHPDSGRHGRGMRVDFDFHGNPGYGIVRRRMNLDVPANYEFSFSVRGDAPTNTLEFKLVDSTDANVWWSNNENFVFSPEWRTIVRKKREICFGWGPLNGGEIRRVSSIEFAITAGSGGKGSVWIDDLALAPLELDSPFDFVAPVASTPIVGTWEPEETFNGGMGIKLDFLPDGSYLLMEGLMLEFDYTVANGRLTVTMQNPITRNSESFNAPIHIEHDTLTIGGETLFGKNDSMSRLGPARDAANPIGGVWTFRDPDGMTAFVEFVKNGHGRFRMPMGVSPGTWTEAPRGHLTATKYNLRIVPHALTCDVGHETTPWDYKMDHGDLLFRNGQGTSGRLIRRVPHE